MGTRTCQTTKTESQKDPLVATSGEVFSDAVIDLMASRDICRPNLLLWDGQREVVAPRIRYGGVIYEAPQLHRSIGQAIRFPASVNWRGTSTELFAEFAAFLQTYMGFREEIAEGLSLWNASTWLSDVLPSPPALAIWGPDMSTAVTLFVLLGCASRRALKLAGVSRAALLGLPMHLRPTWFLNQPDLPRGMWQLCRSSNHRGMVVPGRGGAVLDWVSSKAIFLGVTSSANVLSGEALRISLPPAEPGLPLLDEQALSKMAEAFQARFLAFRLDWLTKERAASSADRHVSFPGSELAQNLFACVRHEPSLIQKITPLLSAQQEEERARRKLDPNFVLIEVFWDPAHAGSEIAVKKIAEEVHVRLRARGEKWVYSEEEIGWMLTHLGFERNRNSGGRVLRFSHDNARLVHEHARKFGLDFPGVEGCAHCAEPETVVPTAVAEV